MQNFICFYFKVPDAVLVKRLRNFEGCGAADNVYTWAEHLFYTNKYLIY